MLSELNPNSASQAALRLTNYQREGVVAAYETLSSQLNAAQQAFGGGAQQLLRSSAAAIGSSGANLVG